MTLALEIIATLLAGALLAAILRLRQKNARLFEAGFIAGHMIASRDVLGSWAEVMDGLPKETIVKIHERVLALKGKQEVEELEGMMGGIDGRE